MRAPEAKKSAQLTRLALKVSPKASRNAVTGWMGDVLKVSVTAAPERGKANEAVTELLAEALSLPRSGVCMLRGETSPQKTVAISGLGPAEVRQRLERAMRQ